MRYFRPDRDFYIPKEYSLKLTAKKAVAEVYLYERGELLFAERELLATFGRGGGGSGPHA